jgi:hypothetical protein
LNNKWMKPPTFYEYIYVCVAGIPFTLCQFLLILFPRFKLSETCEPWLEPAKWFMLQRYRLGGSSRTLLQKCAEISMYDSLLQIASLTDPQRFSFKTGVPTDTTFFLSEIRTLFLQSIRRLLIPTYLQEYTWSTRTTQK